MHGWSARSTQPTYRQLMITLTSTGYKAPMVSSSYGNQTETGKVYFELEGPTLEAIFVESLVNGLGSNDIGLDRGQLGPTRFVRLERSGDRVLLVQPNLLYRAISDNPAEVRATEQAFAESILAAFNIVASNDGRVLFDISDYATSDVHGVAQRIAQSQQGTFNHDPQRSAIVLESAKAFPNNTLVEARVTFSGNDGGAFIQQVTPSPDSVTIRQRLDFIKPPPPGFKPRVFHPRSGFFQRSYVDYAQPLGSPLQQSYIVRHRLQKKDPSAPISEAIEPIVYYVDAGAPEPVKSALIEGASWWNQAFEAAGFSNAFQVRELPADADPLDARYNVIQWVHRATRGWSYGFGIYDPRNGEIIKGHVTLGSLRVAPRHADRRSVKRPILRQRRPRPSCPRVSARTLTPALCPRSRPHSRARA